MQLELVLLELASPPQLNHCELFTLAKFQNQEARPGLPWFNEFNGQ